jgi:hypothetical protein
MNDFDSLTGYARTHIKPGSSWAGFSLARLATTLTQNLSQSGLARRGRAQSVSSDDLMSSRMAAPAAASAPTERW